MSSDFHKKQESFLFCSVPLNKQLSIEAIRLIANNGLQFGKNNFYCVYIPL